MAKEELIYQLSILQQQTQQIQEQLQLVAQNRIELEDLLKGLEELKGKKGGDALASLGRGIFLDVKINSEKLIVDVGGKNFVKKDIEDSKKLINNQLEKVNQFEENLNEEAEKINNQLTNLISENSQEFNS